MVWKEAAKHYLKVTDEDFTKALGDNQGLKSVIESVMHSTEQASTVVIEDILNTQNTGVHVGAGMCSPPKELSTPSRIRTCDLRIRSPLLYPTELWALGMASSNRSFDTV